MNITTDTGGEIIAFGVTVPVPTPSMFHDVLKRYCDTLAYKLCHKADTDEDLKGKRTVLKIPIPVEKEANDSYFSVQSTALRVAYEMTGALQMRGYTVISCTPAAMVDKDVGITDVATGYILSVTHNNNVADVLAGFETEPMACAWTDYAMQTYGQVAVAQAMEEMKEKLQAATNTSVH